jgi:hypothetical protein
MHALEWQSVWRAAPSRISAQTGAAIETPIVMAAAVIHAVVVWAAKAFMPAGPITMPMARPLLCGIGAVG